MANLLYPAYVDRLAIYLRADVNAPKIGQEIPVGLLAVSQPLEWSYGDGYTVAFDQLCAVERTAKLLGREPSEIGLAALIYGRWIAIDQYRLTMEH